MRISIWLTSLLVLFLPGLAVADYEAREREELDNLARMDLEAAERDKIRDGLTRYFDFRERALVDGLQLLAEASASNRDQASRWNDLFDKAGADGVRMIEGLIQNDTAQALKVRLLGIAQVEAIFWGKMRAMPLASTRDNLVAWNEQFRVERESLASKWRALNEQDSSIDSSTEQVQKEVAALFEETAKEIAGGAQVVPNSLRTSLTVWAKTPGMPGGKIAQGLDELVSVLEKMDSKTAALVSAYADLYRREETVVIMFSDTRAAVKAFLAKTNLTTAQAAVADARSKSLELAGQVASDGARADAVEFAGDGIAVFQNHYDRFEDEYEEFVDEFNQIFLGPVGDRTVEDLLEKNRWERWDNDMRARNIEAALNDLYGDLSEWTAIVSDAADLTDADKDLIKEVLGKDIERIAKKVGDVRTLTVSERFKLLFDLTFRRNLEEKGKKD